MSPKKSQSRAAVVVAIVVNVAIAVGVAACGSAPKTGASEQTPAAKTAPVSPAAATPAPGGTTPATDRSAVGQGAAGPISAALDSSKLPACTAALEGELVYETDLKKFEACSTGVWTAITIPTPATSVASTIHCGGELGTTGFSATYDATVMTSGDLFVYGSVSGAAYETGASAYYSSQQQGAVTASVIFTDDVAGPMDGGWWNLTLDRTTMIQTATYNDADVTGGKESWSITPDKCVVNKY